MIIEIYFYFLVEIVNVVEYSEVVELVFKGGNFVFVLFIGWVSMIIYFQVLRVGML